MQVLDRRMVRESRRPHPQGNLASCGSLPPPPTIHRKYSIGNEVRKITSVQFNQDGSQLLASYSEDYVYLFNSGLFGCGSVSNDIIKPAHLSQCECYSPALPLRRKSNLGARAQGSNFQGSKNNAKPPSKEPPAKKKIRLRGDWSDTGPEAQPENDSSESRGRSFMSHMSNMFARWIDMSLNSNEQAGEGEGEGGNERRGPRWRSERRRQPGAGSRGGGGTRRENPEEHRQEGTSEAQNSSSSSDNSFNVFDDTETSSENTSGGSLVKIEEGEEEAEEEGRGEKEGEKEEETVRTKPFNIQTQSSGECTKDESTAQDKLHDACCRKESTASDNRELDDDLTRRETSGGAASSAGTSDSGDTPIVIENRSLNSSLSRTIPKINIIEDDTDSDDFEGATCNSTRKVSHDLEEASHDPEEETSHSTKMRTHNESADSESEGHVAGDHIRPFIVYKGHRNARTMVLLS